MRDPEIEHVGVVDAVIALRNFEDAETARGSPGRRVQGTLPDQLEVSPLSKPSAKMSPVLAASSRTSSTCQPSRVTLESSDSVAVARTIDRSNAAMQSDAPACDVCGAITVRNGTCYKCLNCGSTSGCS